VVGNRVCTTLRSSAYGWTTCVSVTAPAGVAASATTATRWVPAGWRASASTISVVVPERVNATTRSYRRRPES
jgi:hypothetical protein